MKVRAKGRLLLPVGLLSALLLSTVYGQRDAQAQAPAVQAAAAGPAPCPGEPMPVQATGVYQPKPVPDITVNGQPGPGAIWQAGMRSYWHCHAGGQIMMLDEGVGRVQKRGERIRTLRRGETEYAPPGVEHWHGAAHDASAHYFQTSIGNTATFWMEEVGYDDYMGNDTGITSRNEFLRSGVRKKGDAATQPTKAPAAPRP
ncbi:MAG: cupin domain-containing protein [Vicinamibacterales bacterium]